MTSIQQNYYNYLEAKRHNAEMERQGRENLVISQQDADTRSRAQAISEQYTYAQINQIANNIRQKDIELKLKGDMNNWQKTVDVFNQDLAKQRQSLENSKLEFEKGKFDITQSNWRSEYNLKRDQYDQAKKEYDLAVDKFKHQKTMDVWKQVESSAKTLSGIINTWTKTRNDTLKTAAAVAKAAAAK